MSREFNNYLNHLYLGGQLLLLKEIAILNYEAHMSLECNKQMIDEISNLRSSILKGVCMTSLSKIKDIGHLSEYKGCGIFEVNQSLSACCIYEKEHTLCIINLTDEEFFKYNLEIVKLLNERNKLN